MSTPVGVWIDHRRAFLVLLDQTINSKTIFSGARRRPGAPGRSHAAPPFGHEDIVPEDRLNRRYRKHLDEYYQRVTEAIGDAEEIYIMGPGEAKTELKSHLLKSFHNRSPRMILENADKMTDGQIIARFRERLRPQP